jgi:hypothetical protein
MVFEELLNQPMMELDLVDRVGTLLQHHFNELKNANYCLILEDAQKQKSKVSSIKTFHCLYRMADFHFDAEYFHPTILVKFVDDKFHVLVLGVYTHQKMTVWREQIKISLRAEYEGASWPSPMPPRELLKGFDDITGLIASTPRKKAV